MNGIQLKFGHLLPEIKKKFVNDGVKICCECGSLKTTILTRAIYCRSCRSFRSYKKIKIKFIPIESYERFDDDD